MKKDKNRGTEDAGEPAGSSKAERQEKLTQLMLCDAPLSPDQAALLEEVFPDIVDDHYDFVVSLLRKRGVEDQETEDLSQEVFLALHKKALNEGFESDITSMLSSLVWGKAMNHTRAEERDPVTTGLPSSRSEVPGSQLDIERALHFQKEAGRLFALLSPDQQEAIVMVWVKGYTHTEAAAALGLPEGTLKSRVLAAKRAILALAEPFEPPSQRGPL